MKLFFSTATSHEISMIPPEITFESLQAFLSIVLFVKFSVLPHVPIDTLNLMRYSTQIG